VEENSQTIEPKSYRRDRLNHRLFTDEKGKGIDVPATAHIDERGLAWFFVRIAGSRGSAVYHGCTDTGATFCILSEHNCINLGLTRHPDKLKVSLMTVKGDTSANVFIAPSMVIEGTELKAISVEVAAKRVSGFPLILGMSFLSQFNWAFNKQRKEFMIST
jgi:clan AA aspartic protease (TIGR02281 family)